MLTLAWPPGTQLFCAGCHTTWQLIHGPVKHMIGMSPPIPNSSPISPPRWPHPSPQCVAQTILCYGLIELNNNTLFLLYFSMSDCRTSGAKATRQAPFTLKGRKWNKQTVYAPLPPPHPTIWLIVPAAWQSDHAPPFHDVTCGGTQHKHTQTHTKLQKEKKNYRHTCDKPLPISTRAHKIPAVRKRATVLPTSTLA